MGVIGRRRLAKRDTLVAIAVGHRVLGQGGIPHQRSTVIHLVAALLLSVFDLKTNYHMTIDFTEKMHPEQFTNFYQNHLILQ